MVAKCLAMVTGLSSKMLTLAQSLSIDLRMSLTAIVLRATRTSLSFEMFARFPKSSGKAQKINRLLTGGL
jgi:hypothetical protein